MEKSDRTGDQPRRGVSNELIGMSAIGVTLAGLTLATWSDVRAEIRHQTTELRSETRELREAVGRMEDRLRAAIGRLDDRLRTVEIRFGATDTGASAAGGATAAG
ncbi:MAG: hypothetical protein F4X36_09385, partial [Gammaproteobacteria bacterium]|nr:hypothetical protein [Gammaproteobacteria bacterium]